METNLTLDVAATSKKGIFNPSNVKQIGMDSLPIVFLWQKNQQRILIGLVEDIGTRMDQGIDVSHVGRHTHVQHQQREPDKDSDDFQSSLGKLQ